MYKELKKDRSTSWDDISRRVYGTPDKAGDLEKMNNNVSSGGVLAPQQDEDEESSGDGLRVEKGENVYNNFPEFQLIDSLGSIKGAVFICNGGEKYDFKFNEPVKVYDEDGLFLKGYIANIIPCMDDRTTWVQIEIKSDAGVLVETDTPYPLEFVNLTLKQILTDIAGYFGIKIEFSDAKELDEMFKNEIGTSFTAKIDEKLFNFMYRLCKSKGLLLTDTGDGLFVGKLAIEEQEKINFIEGECTGVKSINSRFQTDGLARYYEVNSQYPTSKSETVTIPFPRPITKRFNSNDYNADGLQALASQIACKDIGEHFKVTIILNEHKRLKSGNLSVIKWDSAFIFEETNFIIEKIIREVDNTKIFLTLPCVYTGEIPETLPLCS
jgi:hypothetical protein